MLFRHNFRDYFSIYLAYGKLQQKTITTRAVSTKFPARPFLQNGIEAAVLPEIFTFVESDQSEVNIDIRIENLKYALRYLEGLKDIKWQEVKTSLRPLNLTFKVMDVLEEVKQEGVQEGMEIGIEIGMERKDYITCYNMLKQGFEPRTVAGVSEVQEGFILHLKEQMGKEPKAIQLLKEGELDDAQIAAQLSISPFLVEIWKRGSVKKS